MNDLPIFLQMFVRLFAFLALGAWLQTFVPDTPEIRPDSQHACKAGKMIPKPSEQAAMPCPAPAAGDMK